MMDRAASRWVPPVTDDGPVSAHTRYADDPLCQALVARHPDGATLDLIGAAFGVTHERARQIEEEALKSFARRCRIAGIDVADFVAAMERRTA